MYKKLKDYEFREIVGHFVLMRNTNLIKNPGKYEYMNKRYEEAKLDIIQETKDYYKETMGYDEELDYEDTFSLEALNQEMTTRTVADLYEPLYGYVGIEKMRGLVLYLLGNIEDKYKYIYTTAYNSFEDEDVGDIEAEVIDDEEYEYADFFKEHIQVMEEEDENLLETRKLKELDMYRLKNFPDFVNCIVTYNNSTYIAKVKLSRKKGDKVYAVYHGQEGVLNIIKNENTSFLVYTPLEPIDEKEAYEEYLEGIIEIFESDFDTLKEDVLELIQHYKEEIEQSYIDGEIPFETAYKIYNDLLNSCQEGRGNLTVKKI